MKKFVGIILLLLGICSACREKEVPMVQAEQIWSMDLSQADTSLRSIIEDIVFLPLEMTDESVIFKADKIVVKNGLMYVGDFRSSKVVAFDESGSVKFVVNQKGNGPEEYLEIKSFAVDDKSIYVIDNYRHRLNLYDCTTGKYQETRVLPFVVWDIEILPDKNLIFTYIPFKEGGGPNLKQERCKIFITDSLLNIEKQMFEYEEDEYEFIGKMTYFVPTRQGVVFNSMASDDLYLFGGKDSIRRIALDFAHKIPLEKRTDWEEIQQRGYNYLVNTPLFCKHYMFFSSTEDGMVLDYAYDIRNEHLFTNDRVNAYKGLLTPQAVSHDKVIAYFDNFLYYQELVKAGFERASREVEKHLEAEKPVLVFYTLN